MMNHALPYKTNFSGTQLVRGEVQSGFYARPRRHSL